MIAPRHIVARAWTRLPADFHYSGPPNDWVRMTRPGMTLHSFLEGPAFDGQGALWLADVPYGRVFRILDDGEWNLPIAYDGEPHGLAIRDDGSLLVCDYRHGLTAMDTVGQPNVIVPAAADGPFLGIADLAIAPNGDVWVTDPGRSSMSVPDGRLYRLRSGATVPERVLSDLPYPNSVCLSPDGSLAYVSMTRSNAIWRLSATAAECPPMAGIHIQLSGGLGPDGLAMHPDGWLAVAQAQAGRAYVFDSLGDPVARIDTPDGNWTTAVRFTPDGSALIIVEAQSGTIYRVPVEDIIANRD